MRPTVAGRRRGSAKAPRARRAAASADLATEPRLRELRSAIANLRAAAEALAAVPTGAPRGAPDTALLSAVIEEAERASRTVEALAAIALGPGVGRGPAKRTSARRFAADLVRRAASDLELAVHVSTPIADHLTLAPTFVAPILGALGRLRRDYGVGEVELSARRHADLLALEVAFSVREPESSRLRAEHANVLAGGWHDEPSLGDAARAAGGEAWLAIRRGEATFSLRILLPLTSAA